MKKCDVCGGLKICNCSEIINTIKGANSRDEISSDDD